MLSGYAGGYLVKGTQGVKLPAGEPNPVVNLPGLYLLLREWSESIASRCAHRVKRIPQVMPGWWALGLQPVVQGAGVDIEPLQMGPQAGSVTLGRVEVELIARKLRQAFAELLIKRSVSSMAFLTWARTHWSLGSTNSERAFSGL